MSTTEKPNTDLFRDWANLFSAAHVAFLCEIGHDFIEAKRQGPYLWDDQGNQYIDCHTAAGTYNLGRSQPDLLARLHKAAIQTDQGNFPIISREKAALAQRLAEFVPGDLECSLFSVVRGEAFDFACKLARGFTEREQLLAFEGSWFGHTGFALSLSQRDDKEDFAPLVPEAHILPYGKLNQALEAITTRTAAVFLEPVQAENLCRMPDRAHLAALRKRCDQTGALLIFDETQTGLGRCGKKFAFELFDVQPDVLILGEALGAGVFPIAATMFTQRIAAFMNDHPLIHLSTFGGSDVGCMVARKALDIYEETAPWENAAALGETLKTSIEDLIEQDGVIFSVQGTGLLLALDLGTPELARAFCKAAASAGLLIYPGEVAKDTVVVRPALTITEKDVAKILEGLAQAQDALRAAPESTPRA